MTVICKARYSPPADSIWQMGDVGPLLIRVSQDYSVPVGQLSTHGMKEAQLSRLLPNINTNKA